MRQVQQVLKQGRCYDGAMNGRSSSDTQEALDDFVVAAGKKGKAKAARIELAKATAGDFEAWLRDARAAAGEVCCPTACAAEAEGGKAGAPAEEPQRRRAERPAAEPREPQSRRQVLLGPTQRAAHLQLA